MDGTKQTDTTAEAALHAARIEELRRRIGDVETLVIELGCIGELLYAVANTCIQLEPSCLVPVAHTTREISQKLEKWFLETHGPAREMAR